MHTVISIVLSNDRAHTFNIVTETFSYTFLRREPSYTTGSPTEVLTYKEAYMKPLDAFISLYHLYDVLRKQIKKTDCMAIKEKLNKLEQKMCLWRYELCQIEEAKKANM
ncbi:MAG: hypothetical protein LQ337_006250 [Flavoplaca oasis]|nr:MAG: hypothetical protein LQ337_006250 [Flavoplaca oasis]